MAIFRFGYQSIGWNYPLMNKGLKRFFRANISCPRL